MYPKIDSTMPLTSGNEAEAVENALAKINMKSALQKAIDGNQFRICYQPLFDVSSGNITSLEALIRWHHPILGVIQPNQFIPIAEQTDLVKPIGAWVIRSACLHNMALQKAGRRAMPVAVNLSARQLLDKNLTAIIGSALTNSGLNPAYLILEITETAAIQHLAQAVRTLRHLKKFGVKIALDDFGTGYSSLSYLDQLPIDILKIDRSFIEGMSEENGKMTITSAIVELAHKLGLEVVAEGVETRDQLSCVTGIRCDKIQGFLLGKPVSFYSLQKML